MPPNSALTRFLKQGLKRGVCPLCRVAYKMDGEYMWAFFDDYSSDDKTLDRLREARGFCAEHAERLRRLEVEGLHSNLGISNVYLDTLQGLEEALQALDPAEEFGEPGIVPGVRLPRRGGREERPLPARGDRGQRLLAPALHGVERICFPHFELVWDRADPDERTMLLELQRRVVGRLAISSRRTFASKDTSTTASLRTMRPSPGAERST